MIYWTEDFHHIPPPPPSPYLFLKTLALFSPFLKKEKGRIEVFSASQVFRKGSKRERHLTKKSGKGGGGGM